MKAAALDWPSFCGRPLAALTGLPVRSLLSAKNNAMQSAPPQAGGMDGREALKVNAVPVPDCCARLGVLDFVRNGGLA